MPSPTDTTDLDALVCCGTAMRKASRRIAQLYDVALAPSGLKSTQYAILSELSRRETAPPTLQDLALSMVMDRSTLGHNLRPLERDGLVALEEGVADRRTRHIVLTKRGRTRLEGARVHWQKAQDRVHEIIGRPQADRLRKTLLGIAYDDRLALEASP